MSTFSRNIIIQSKVIASVNVRNTAHAAIVAVPTNAYVEVVCTPLVSGVQTNGDTFALEIDDGTTVTTIYTWLFNGTNWICNFSANVHPIPQASPTIKVGPLMNIKCTNTQVNAGAAATMQAAGVEFLNAVQ